MVSLLDIGSLNGGLSANIVELGDGFNELSEDWGPKIEETQYIHQTTSLSMSFPREYLSVDVQEAIADLFMEFPTGSACETYYGRFYKTDASGSGDTLTAKGMRVPVTVAPSSTGGSAGSPLTSGIEIHGNGKVEKGTWTISKSGSKTTYSIVAD